LASTHGHLQVPFGSAANMTATTALLDASGHLGSKLVHSSNSPTGCMQAVMHHPVIAADGHTYERHAVEQWLQHRTTSPVTGAQLRPPETGSQHRHQISHQGSSRGIFMWV